MSDFSQSVNGARSRTSFKASKDSRVGVQWHTVFQPLVGTCVEMFLFDSGYGGVVNINGGRANIALVTRPEIAQLAREDFGSFLAKTLFSNPATRRRLESPTPAGGTHTAFPITPLTHQSSHPDAFLVGDARRTVEPFTGEGILFALQDAFIAAQQVLFRYRKNHFPHFTHRSNMLANTVVSPLLRNPRLADRVTRFGSKLPFLTRPILDYLFL